MSPHPVRGTAPARGGTLRVVGWLLALALAVSLATLAWGLGPILRGRGSHALGDGKDPTTYGFALEPLLAPREALAASGMPRDGLRALVDPEMLPAALANDHEALGVLRGRYLVPGQRVVGLALDGDVRAYPLRVLNWHEVINDTVGGIPVAVTYCPLTDSAAVWDRRVGGRTLTFGVSGLLLDSNTLLYDRADGGGESLWTQLTGRAVAGPAAGRGEALALVPAEVVPWAAWRARHPDTVVLKPDPALFKLYRRDPYGAYYGDGRLRFPVVPSPRPGHPAAKDRVVAIAAGGRWWVLPWAALAGAGEAPRRVALGGEPFELAWHAREPSVAVRRPDGTPAPAVSAMWFAWNALARAPGPPRPPAGTGASSHLSGETISRSGAGVLNYRLLKPEPAATRRSSGRRPLWPNVPALPVGRDAS
ncbi:MAG: DUF3179 domain-containing protein [Acidobacteria bacterium]|nr:MAG: DUF3179 domain-containing protein [Acidobacteriota bacterium]